MELMIKRVLCVSSVSPIIVALDRPSYVNSEANASEIKIKYLLYSDIIILTNSNHMSSMLHRIY